MSWQNRLGNRLLAPFGLVLHRAPTHRFDAVEEALLGLRNRGYRPRRVLDVGANRGQWAGKVLPIFPAARFDLIEPQPSCRHALAELTGAQAGRVVHHAVAATAPGTPFVRMAGTGEESSNTGAHVTLETAVGTVEMPATTLDTLFAVEITPADRALLKLDIEGHEIAALTGAERLLAAVEVILAEVQFFEIEQNGLPTFTDLLLFLRDRGFDFHDVACLASRRRDGRLRMGDVLFVRKGSELGADVRWG
jgi:FkbM family methyltransferase